MRARVCLALRLSFTFAITPPLLVQGIIWATLIGLISGPFPASRAAALREL